MPYCRVPEVEIRQLESRICKAGFCNPEVGSWSPEAGIRKLVAESWNPQAETRSVYVYMYIQDLLVTLMRYVCDLSRLSHAFTYLKLEITMLSVLMSFSRIANSLCRTLQVHRSRRAFLRITF